MVEEEKELKTIYVGTKPLIRYVMALLAIFLNERPERIRVAARGKSISRAVDLVEVIRSRYLEDVLEVDSIELGTDKFEDKDHPSKFDHVSSIEILLKRTGGILPQEIDELDNKLP